LEIKHGCIFLVLLIFVSLNSEAAKRPDVTFVKRSFACHAYAEHCCTWVTELPREQSFLLIWLFGIYSLWNLKIIKLFLLILQVIQSYL